MRANGPARAARRGASRHRPRAWLAASLAAGGATLGAACWGASDSQAPVRAPALAVPPQSVRHELDLSGRRAIAVSVAAHGSHVVVAWSASDGVGTDLFAAASADSGRTFSPPQRVNGRPHTVDAADPPGLALVPTGNAVRAYVVWTSSLDQAGAVHVATAESAAWVFDERLPPLATASLRPAPVVIAGDEGKPFVVWRRGGHPATPVAPAASPRRDRRAGRPGGAWLYAAPWDAAGAGTIDPIARDACDDGEAAVTAGPSGELQVAWQRVPSDDGADVAVARTTPGSGFEAPVLLGALSDRASRSARRVASGACGAGGLTMSTDATGLTHVVWRAASGDGEREGALFLAWSRDARAFTRPTRVDRAEGLDPQHPRLAVVGGSDIALVWDAEQGDRRRVWLRVTAGTCGRVADPFGPAAVVSGEASATRPAVAAAHEGLVVAWIEQRPDGPVVVARRLVWADIESWP